MYCSITIKILTNFTIKLLSSFTRTAMKQRISVANFVTEPLHKTRQNSRTKHVSQRVCWQFSGPNYDTWHLVYNMTLQTSVIFLLFYIVMNVLIDWLAAWKKWLMIHAPHTWKCGFLLHLKFMYHNSETTIVSYVFEFLVQLHFTSHFV